MDNTNDFEKQFAQSVKSSISQTSQNEDPPMPPQPAPQDKPSPSRNPSWLLVVVIMVLAVVVLIEAVALVILIKNVFYAEPDNYVDDTDTSENNVQDNKYVYDTDDRLSAVQLICITEGGLSYEFETDNTYHFNDLAGSSSSGTYSIVNDNLISLQDPNNDNKVLFYDGLNLADGLTIYVCE